MTNNQSYDTIKKNERGNNYVIDKENNIAPKQEEKVYTYAKPNFGTNAEPEEREEKKEEFEQYFS